MADLFDKVCVWVTFVFFIFISFITIIKATGLWTLNHIDNYDVFERVSIIRKNGQQIYLYYLNDKHLLLG